MKLILTINLQSDVYESLNREQQTGWVWEVIDAVNDVAYVEGHELKGE